MAKSSIEIMDRGMKSLIRELGIVEAEYFITFLKQDRFDYTKWRQTVRPAKGASHSGQETSTR